MPKHLTKNAAEIVILQKNLKDLQAKLETAHEKILELTKGNNIAKEELKLKPKHKQRSNEWFDFRKTKLCCEIGHRIQCLFVYLII